MRLAFFTLLTIIASTQLHAQTTAPDVRDIEFGRPDGIPLSVLH